MNTQRLLVVSLAGMLTVQAQDPNVAVCNVVFNQGIRDVQSIYTRVELANSYKSRLCDVKFTSYESFQSSTGSLGLDLPLAEGLLGLTGDATSKSGQFQTAYSKFCSSTYFDQEYKSRYDNYISIISSALLSSWNKCQELYLKAYVEKQGVYAYVDNPDFDAFTVRFRANPPGSGGIKIKSLNPDGQVKCTRGGVDLKANTIISENESTFSCRKDPDRSIQFSVDTTLGATREIRLPARTSKVLELDNRLTELSDLLKLTGLKLQQTAEAQNRDGQTLLRLMNNGTAAESQHNIPNVWRSSPSGVCPAGQYMVGLTVRFEGSCNNQCNGDGNMPNNFTVICRSIR